MIVGIMGDTFTMSTAYARVTRNLLVNLRDRGHEVRNYALQYSGFPVKLGGITMYSASSIEDVLRQVKEDPPDIMIHLRDNWVYTPLSGVGTYHIKEDLNAMGVKLINYTPVQSLPMPPDFDISVFNDADFTLFTTRWASEWYRGMGCLNCDYLYHGVDAEIKRVEAHRGGRFPDGTMMLNIGYAMDYRKATPLVLKLLERYQKTDDAAFAYLHTQRKSHYLNDVIASTIDLRPGSVIFPSYNTHGSTRHGITGKDLNYVYNTADVYVNLSVSEGFDMTSLEAASLGMPVIVNDFPVHREILQDFPNVRYVKSTQTFPTVWGFEWMPDIDDALESMLSLQSSGFVKKDPMVPEQFKWDNITDKLEKIMERVVE